MSIVRQNLMTSAGYSPYCGADTCRHNWPRTTFMQDQFQCRCGWRSAFPRDFIAEYKAKWGLK